jgi:hypothetical protein
MVKLPSAEAAGGAAGLADEFVGCGGFFEAVEGFLDGAFYVVAEFSGFIISITVYGHGWSMLMLL